MNLLKTILEEGVNDANLESLLRKARVAGDMLSIPELVDWSKWELNGYPESVHVPRYRQLPFALVAMSWTPKGILPINLPNHCFQKNPDDKEEIRKAKDLLSTEKWDIRDPIAKIEGWIANNKEGAVHFSLNEFLPLMPNVLQQCITQPYRGTIQDLYVRLDIASLKHLLSGVKNNLLEMVLALKRNVPDLFEDLNLSMHRTATTQARNIIQVYIDVSQHINTNQVHSSVIKDLDTLGVNPEDLNKLKEILQQEGKRGVFRWLYDIAGRLAEHTFMLVVQAIFRHLFSNG